MPKKGQVKKKRYAAVCHRKVVKRGYINTAAGVWVRRGLEADRHRVPESVQRNVAAGHKVPK